MENFAGSFVDGTIANYWIGTWLPLVGFVVAIVAALLVLWRAPLTMAGLTARGMVALAVLATGPLAFYKAGLRVAITDFELIIFLSIVGSTAAALLGITALFTRPRPFMLAGRQVGLDTLFGSVKERDVSKTQMPAAAPASVVKQPVDATVVVAGGVSSGMGSPLSGHGTVLTIGRDPDNDVVIDDPSVSRHHATISYENDQTMIADLGSSNGIVVAGERVKQGTLVVGSRIRLGNAELELNADRRPVTVAVASPVVKVDMLSDIPSDTGDTVVRSTGPDALAWFAVKSGAHKAQSFELGASTYKIGRDLSGDIVLTDASVSREHASLRYRDGSYVLTDAGSLGGTRVNGERVGGLAWQQGALLRIGETVMTLASYQANDEAPVESDRTYVPQAPRTGAMVFVQEGPGAGTTFHLRDGNNVLGRGANCDIALSDETVSRAHCVVQLVDGKITVFDAGSTSGTEVNGVTTTGRTLRNGDQVTFGNVEVQFVAVEL